MKLILAIIQADDTAKTTDALTGCGYRVTRMATCGGWLRQSNVTLLIGLTTGDRGAGLGAVKASIGLDPIKEIAPVFSEPS